MDPKIFLTEHSIFGSIMKPSLMTYCGPLCELECKGVQMAMEDACKIPFSDAIC
jgi:hypothetical protein